MSTGARSFNDLFRLVERAGISKASQPDEIATANLHLECEKPHTGVHDAGDVAAWLAVPGNVEKLCKELNFAAYHAGFECRTFPMRTRGAAMLWCVSHG